MGYRYCIQGENSSLRKGVNNSSAARLFRDNKKQVTVELILRSRSMKAVFNQDETDYLIRYGDNKVVHVFRGIL